MPYYDADGNECTLPVMCMREPGWAANRLQHTQAELSALRARVAELTSELQQCALAMNGTSSLLSEGIVHVEELMRENTALRSRLATLEAPPVVPDGYEVTNGFCARWNLWSPTADRPVVLDSPAALRALAYAIETGQRPPHASDGEKTP